MKQIVKSEAKRMFLSIKFMVVLILGCAISVWFFLQNTILETINIPNQPRSAYISWMGSSTYWMQSYWYFLIFPLLAVLPFAGTFFEDKKSGYIKSVLLRSSKREYFLAKGLMIFLSGGLSVTIPLCVSFILTATKLPLLYPEIYIGFGPRSHILMNLFYTHPFLYTLGYLLFDFIMGGIFALMAMVLCYQISIKYLALMLPFAVCYVLGIIDNFFQKGILSINLMLAPGFGIPSIVSVFLFLIFIIGTISMFLWSSFRYEEI